MDLECVIPSEVSQKEKNKYRVLTHISVSRKMVRVPLFPKQEHRCRHTEWICGHSVGRRGWDDVGD